MQYASNYARIGNFLTNQNFKKRQLHVLCLSATASINAVFNLSLQCRKEIQILLSMGRDFQPY